MFLTYQVLSVKVFDCLHTGFGDVERVVQDFLEADLQGASFWNATFDTTTVLPGGTTWTSQTDITRFTNPEHSSFWRSVEYASPSNAGDAYSIGNEPLSQKTVFELYEADLCDEIRPLLLAGGFFDPVKA
jgi:hypothetical protein